VLHTYNRIQAWLRENAEKRAAEIVTTRSDTIRSSMIFCTTWRSTGSDVLSIITTTKPLYELEPQIQESPKKSVGEAWVLRADEAGDRVLGELGRGSQHPSDVVHNFNNLFLDDNFNSYNSQ
jgi:hypothetical protein